jgi:hypothetical protein
MSTSVAMGSTMGPSAAPLLKKLAIFPVGRLTPITGSAYIDMVWGTGSSKGYASQKTPPVYTRK